MPTRSIFVASCCERVGQDANNAWKTTSNIIKALGVNAEVTFSWYDNPKAVSCPLIVC